MEQKICTKGALLTEVDMKIIGPRVLNRLYKEFNLTKNGVK